MGRTVARVASPSWLPFATGPLALFPNPSQTAPCYYTPRAGLARRCCQALLVSLVSELFLTLLSWLWFDLNEAENTAVCCHPSFCFICTGPGPWQCRAVTGDSVEVTYSEKPSHSQSHRKQSAHPVSVLLELGSWGRIWGVVLTAFRLQPTKPRIWVRLHFNRNLKKKKTICFLVRDKK